MGMSGGLMINALLRETGWPVSAEEARNLQDAHMREYHDRIERVRALPGACELLKTLTDVAVPWAIATSADLHTAMPTLGLLSLDPDAVVVTRDEVQFAKPDPDLFLEAARRLRVDIQSSIVVGDSVWDMLAARRARALGVGLPSGGYGQDELERAGSYRVYEDPADLLRHLDEVGVRTPVPS
jgi:HAD superfamily hydrolase (TIGR01549 family)